MLRRVAPTSPSGARLAFVVRAGAGVGGDTDSEGFAWIPEDDFVGHFAADIDPVKAKVMYAVQQPLHTSTFEDVMGAPAWKSLPSWYLVAENDVDSTRCREAVRTADGRRHDRGRERTLRDGLPPGGDA
jgi:hypothetical protein